PSAAGVRAEMLRAPAPALGIMSRMASPLRGATPTSGSSSTTQPCGENVASASLDGNSTAPKFTSPSKRSRMNDTTLCKLLQRVTGSVSSSWSASHVSITMLPDLSSTRTTLGGAASRTNSATPQTGGSNPVSSELPVSDVGAPAVVPSVVELDSPPVVVSPVVCGSKLSTPDSIPSAPPCVCESSGGSVELQPLP